MRLIDANALKDVLLDLDVKSDDLKWKCAIEEAIQKIFPKIIDDQPTIKVEDSVQKKRRKQEMNSYRKSEKVTFWAVVVLFTVVVVGCFAIDSYLSYNDTIYTVTVTDKENVNRGDSGYYLIFCKDADDNYYEFQNIDSFYRGKFDSSSVYNKIEVGHTYEFTVVGLRVPFLSWYQNIIEMKDVTDKTS